MTNSGMKVAISIEHPAWAHQFKTIIQNNNVDGSTLVLAVNKDKDLQLLDAFGIEYINLANSTGKNILEKGVLFIRLCISYTRHIRRFNPDILIGRASPMMAVAAFFTGKPHVIFEDTEVSRFSLGICKLLSTYIVTPQSFMHDLGVKQQREPVYKELFYLHRSFSPDISIVKDIGIDTNQPYTVVRFISWNASHDVGINGLDKKQKISFINRLSEIIKVYISSEEKLPEELAQYQLKVPYEKIHHVLYYATLVFSEGASMASEAAILGTHTFYINQLVSGTTNEQQNRFHLLRVFHDPKTDYDKAIAEAVELLKDKDIWQKGKEKREELLREMPDPNGVFLKKMVEVCGKK